MKLRFGIKSLLAFIAFSAMATYLCLYQSITVRCDYGPVTITGGYLPPGEIVEVYGRKKDGKFNLLVQEALVVGEPRWEGNGRSIHVVELRVHISKLYAIEGFYDYRLRFPDSKYAYDPMFDQDSPDNNAMNAKPPKNY